MFLKGYVSVYTYWRPGREHALLMHKSSSIHFFLKKDSISPHSCLNLFLECMKQEKIKMVRN